MTTDVDRRVAEHQQAGPLAARYTRAFGPVKLAYACELGAKALAYRVEYRLKRLPRAKKKEVVANNLSKDALVSFMGIEE